MRARRLRSPLLLSVWGLLAFEAVGGIVIFVARLAAGSTPGEALHVGAGVALTIAYAVYQWRHWRRVRHQRGLHFVMGVFAALFMALANLTGLALGVAWWRDRVVAGAAAADYPPLLSAVHNIGSMLVLTFVGAHLAAVLMRDRRIALLQENAMSEVSTEITADHFRYIAEHTIPEDEFLRQLKQAAAAAGIPSIWIAPEQASFMRILLRLARAREVVEVGTLAGYSAIAMARALPPDGRVRTIELEPRHADFAEHWIARSDVAGRVQVLRGAGMDVLPRFAADSADAAFLDADKSSYPRYLSECLRIVRRGGLIMVDNALAFGQLLDPRAADREVPAVRAFNEHIAKVRELESVIVPLGDGLWVGVKR